MNNVINSAILIQTCYQVLKTQNTSDSAGSSVKCAIHHRVMDQTKVLTCCCICRVYFLVERLPLVFQVVIVVTYPQLTTVTQRFYIAHRSHSCFHSLTDFTFAYILVQRRSTTPTLRLINAFHAVWLLIALRKKKLTRKICQVNNAAIIEFLSI